MNRINIILLCLLFLTCGCKKNPFDYRTKYIGNYQFVIHKQAWIMPSHTTDTTYVIDGKIDYGKDKQTIAIYWLNFDDPSFPELYEDGSFKGYGITGDFYTPKQPVFTFYAFSMASTIHYSVSGERKK